MESTYLMFCATRDPALLQVSIVILLLCMAVSTLLDYNVRLLISSAHQVNDVADDVTIAVQVADAYSASTGS